MRPYRGHARMRWSRSIRFVFSSRKNYIFVKKGKKKRMTRRRGKLQKHCSAKKAKLELGNMTADESRMIDDQDMLQCQTPLEKNILRRTIHIDLLFSPRRFLPFFSLFFFLPDYWIFIFVNCTQSD